MLKVKCPARPWSRALRCSFRFFVRICIFVNVNMVCLSYLPFFTNSLLFVQRKSTTCLIIVFFTISLLYLFLYPYDRYYSLQSYRTADGDEQVRVYIFKFPQMASSFAQWFVLLMRPEVCAAQLIYMDSSYIALPYLKVLRVLYIHTRRMSNSL